MTTDELIARTIAWGEKHKITNIHTQALKTVEELAETISELNHGRLDDDFEDGIGDTLISLTIFAHIAGKDIRKCWADALSEIEGRTGATVDGNFIKDEWKETPKRKIVRNRVRCKKCGDIIESKSVHDCVWCSCGAIFTDGGTDYIHRGGNPEDMEDMGEEQ